MKWKGSVARATALAAALAVGASGLAACSGNDNKHVGATGNDGGSASVPSPASTTTTLGDGVGSPAPPGISPLTGLPGDAAHTTRPALVVKIDNAPEARPQAGLDKADLVIEEKVEGTVVRFMAVFQSQDADLVGPVRSVRSTDPDVVRPLGGLFAYSGGIPEFVGLLHEKGGVKDVGADADGPAYSRRKGRPAPHNLYTSTAKLYAKADAGMAPPPLWLPRLADGQAFAAPGATPTTKATVVFGIRTTAVWDFDAASGKWKRSTNGTPHTVEGAGQLAFATVILQQVPYRDTGFKDQSKAVVDEAVVVGTGNATILVGGQQVQAKWTKATPESVTTYTDSAGSPIRVPAGPVWISLVNVDASVALA